MPAGGVKHLTHREVLRNEEFVRLVDVFAAMGIKKLRFTGGEPLVRKGLIDIIAAVREKHPGLELCLTTNGVLLGGFIEKLYENGVNRLNISLDTLSRERYHELTGFDLLDVATTNIDKVLEFSNFDVKINAVLFRDTLNEIDNFLDYFSKRDVTLRFIEMMPFSDSVENSDFLPAEEFVKELSKRGEVLRKNDMDTSVAMMYNFIYKRKSMRIGVIPPVTHKFCSTCNRLRLTSDGFLRTCLHSGKTYSLKKIIRDGGSDSAVTDEIKKALAEKTKGHEIECWYDGEGCAALQTDKKMSQIGG